MYGMERERLCKDKTSTDTGSGESMRGKVASGSPVQERLGSAVL
jgi:hypothetical protein